MAFGPDDAVDLAEVTAEDVAKEEQEGVKGLVLGGGGGAMLDGERGEEAADFLVAELERGPAADEGLEAGDPKPISGESPGGVVAELDGAFEVAVFALPGGRAWFWYIGCGG